MTEWIIQYIKPISETSIYSNNLGQTAHQAKFEIGYVNFITGETSRTTDLDKKKYKRNKLFSRFLNTYYHYMDRQDVSVLSFVTSQEKYDNISKFINTLTRKLTRKGITRYGYIWIRDIGDIKFHNHFHVLMAISRINSQQFNELFNHKEKSGYDVQFMRTKTGMINYIKKKELYGKKRQRTYGRSRQFNTPQ